MAGSGLPPFEAGSMGVPGSFDLEECFEKLDGRGKPLARLAGVVAGKGFARCRTRRCLGCARATPVARNRTGFSCSRCWCCSRCIIRATTRQGFRFGTAIGARFLGLHSGISRWCVNHGIHLNGILVEIHLARCGAIHTRHRSRSRNIIRIRYLFRE